MQENYSPQHDVKALSEKLTACRQDYELINRESGTCVNICFIGIFNNRQVVWNANIQTLKNKIRESLFNLTTDLDDISIRQSIEVSENNDHYAINVALNLKQIDEAAIKRTIIMVRKYKRLYSGYYEYGEAITFKRTD